MKTSLLIAQPRTTHLAKLAALLILLAGAFATHEGYAADDDRAGYEQFIDGIGKSLFFMAWPTASYRRASFEHAEPLTDGARLTFTLHGISGFDGSSLWLQVILEVRSWKIARLDWGEYNGVVPPGTTIKVMGEALDRLNEQIAANRQQGVPAAAIAATHVAAICLYNPTAQDITYSVKLNSRTETTVLEPGKTMIIWSSADQPDFPITFPDSLTARHGSKMLTVTGVLKPQRPTSCDDGMTVEFQVSGDLLGIGPHLWTPGFDNPFIEHVVAADTAGVWKCAPGYRWYAPQDRNSLVCVDANVGIIGMIFAPDSGAAFPKIADVVKDSAAGDAGIIAGEYLLHVNGTSVKGLTTESVLGMIRGDIGMLGGQHPLSQGALAMSARLP